MADTIVVVKEDTSQCQISSQRSQNSLYSSPEAVELYQTGWSLGSKPHSGSQGLSSSFILVSDESNCGGESPFSQSEYVEIICEEDENKSSCPRSKSRLNANLEGSTAILSGEPKEGRLTAAAVDSTLDVGHGLEKKRTHGGAALNGDHKRSPSLTDSLLKPNLTAVTSEVGTQTNTDTRDGCTQTLPEIKEEKRRPSATSPTSVLEHNDLNVSPLGSPNDEVVDMSASTVLIERHISQKEGRILKNNNKELRLKIKKLTDVLESLQKENLRLKNEAESKVNEADLQSALELKEKEHRRHLEEMEKQQDLELEQYRNRVQKAVEYETTAEERMKENAKVITELQKSITVLQEQLKESQKRQETLVEKVEHLNAKLQHSETKRTVAESENSVLNEKINHLMKELAVLKKSGKHHHHHHHHQEQPSDDKTKHQVLSNSSKQSSPKKDVDHSSKEDIAPNSSEAQKQAKQDHLDVHVGATQGSDATKLEASLASQVRSNLKPKPRQKLYESNNQHHCHASHADKQKEPKPKPVQALVAPQLPLPLHSGAAAKHIRGELLLPYRHQQQQQITTKPPQQKLGPSAAQSKDRPSFLPLKGQAQAAPAHLPLPLEPQTEPTPPLSDAQKLAATANWVQQLPEPKHSKAQETPEYPKTRINTVTWKKECATKGTEERDVREVDDLNSLSEERIEEITRQLKGENAVVCECPICGKVLHSRESDYGVQLHVELCLQQSAARD